MAIEILVRRTRRVTLVRFARAGVGDPVLDRPDVDDRSHRPPERGEAVGVTAGDTITVKLQRLAIDHNAPLFLTSSNVNTFVVDHPESGRVPAGAESELRLRGVTGGNPNNAFLEVRHGAPDGPILHRMTVRCFELLDVDLTIHRVTINGPGGAAGTAPVADVDAIMAFARAVWRSCGIHLNHGAAVDKTIQLAAADRVSDDPFPGELRTLLATNWPDGTANRVPNTINVYLVRQIGAGNTLGYGFSRASFAGFGLPNPGIILADRTAGGPRDGMSHWANDMAHEIGHFFRLWHPEEKQPNEEREDSWSRRMLMHNFNRMRGTASWPNDGNGNPWTFRPRKDDAGYGPRRRGCLVTQKDLRQLRTDNECATARATIISAAGPY